MQNIINMCHKHLKKTGVKVLHGEGPTWSEEVGDIYENMSSKHGPYILNMTPLDSYHQFNGELRQKKISHVLIIMELEVLSPL